MKSNKLLAIGAGWVCAASLTYASQTVTYTYDPLGRLIESQTQGGSGSGTTQVFQYDPAGNRTQYRALMQVAVSMNSPVVDLTPSGARINLNISNPSATGTITLTGQNGASLGPALVVSGGRASGFLQGLAKGTYTITATYSGDGSDAPQTTTFTINVQNLSWLPAVLQLLLQ